MFTNTIFRYSICGMNITNFLIMSRLAIHLRNKEVNELFLRKLKRRFDEVAFNSELIAIPRFKGEKIFEHIYNSDSERNLR